MHKITEEVLSKLCEHSVHGFYTDERLHFHEDEEYTYTTHRCKNCDSVVGKNIVWINIKTQSIYLGYTSLNNVINEAERKISNLETQNNVLENTINDLRREMDGLRGEFSRVKR